MIFFIIFLMFFFKFFIHFDWTTYLQSCQRILFFLFDLSCTRIRKKKTKKEKRKGKKKRRNSGWNENQKIIFKNFWRTLIEFNKFFLAFWNNQKNCFRDQLAEITFQGSWTENSTFNRKIFKLTEMNFDCSNILLFFQSENKL